MHPDILFMVVKAQHDDVMREVQQDRLARVARATVTAYRNRRTDLRQRENRTTTPIPALPNTLVREPAA